MKSNIFVIIKKEFARFFGDKRMAFTTILLPGLLIYSVYNIMGSAIVNNFTVDETYVASVAAVNLPDSFGWLRVQDETTGVALTEIDSRDIGEYKQLIADKALDLLVVFPENFDADVAAYESASGLKAPNVDLFSNATSMESQSAYAMFYAMLDTYESMLANKFDVNNGGEVYDLATERDTTGMIFSSILPMLLMILLFSGCVAVAPESIAGEKERGTIATLLVTPMKRGELAIGKIISLAAISLLGGASSATGMLLSLPKLMGAETDEMNAAQYSVTDYVMLACVILSTVLVFITLISIISAFAKTIKEAQTFIMPMMILVMLVGMSAMFGGGVKADAYFYMIPIYNSVQCMVSIFSFDIAPVNLAVTVAANLVCAGVGAFILTKMFNNEKIMFNKA